MVEERVRLCRRARFVETIERGTLDRFRNPPSVGGVGGHYGRVRAPLGAPDVEN